MRDKELVDQEADLQGEVEEGKVSSIFGSGAYVSCRKEESKS